MTPDGELFQRVRRLLHAEARLFGSSAHDAVTLRRDGVLASINPRAPDRSMFNWVIADTRAALLNGYDDLARAYSDAGVRAWTVWVDEGDVETERELTLRGHVLDARPRAMAAEISSLSLPAAADLSWTETDDVATVAAINDAAYAFPPPAFAAALTRNNDPRWRAYLAHGEGRPVASVMTYESVDGDCGVSAVATLPEMRGSGIASRLLGVALLQAAGRGVVTTTLQATSKGAPLYGRLGYRDLGAMCMWERRTPKPGPSAAANGT
jgi:GNAT superfamily N-acetyltransferase